METNDELERELLKYEYYYRYSSSWNALKNYVKPIYRLFYRKVVVEGRENIPAGVPLIFAPNHQNAVMDPLAVLFAADKQIVFLARADIFKIRFLQRFFRMIKMLPIYRVRDGKNTLSNNDLIFNVAVRVLENGGSVGLFPEARHCNKRHLLDLKKGIPRLAFLAEEKNDFNLNIHIVPVGLYYSNYPNMLSIMHLQFGKPLAVRDYRQAYLEQPQRTLLTLRDDLAAAIRPLMVDIQNLEHYDDYETLRLLCRSHVMNKLNAQNTQAQRFKADKITIAAFEQLEHNNSGLAADIFDAAANLRTATANAGVQPQLIDNQGVSLPKLCLQTFLATIFLPLFVYGVASNLLVYLPMRLLLLKIGDRQFHSSVKFLWGLVVAPIIYLIQIVVFAVLVPLLWPVISFAVSLPTTGYFAVHYARFVGGLAARWRLRVLQSCRKRVYSGLRASCEQLLQKALPVIDKELENDDVTR